MAQSRAAELRRLGPAARGRPGLQRQHQSHRAACGGLGRDAAGRPRHLPRPRMPGTKGSHLAACVVTRSDLFPSTRIQVGNGSTEIFHLLARAFLTTRTGQLPGAFLLTPTYGEYAGACRLAGGPVLSFDAGPETGFRWDLEEAAARIERSKPALVILCNPNNPTGVYLRPSEVELLAAASQRAGCPVCNGRGLPVICRRALGLPGALGAGPRGRWCVP